MGYFTAWNDRNNYVISLKKQKVENMLDEQKMEYGRALNLRIS